MKTKAIASIIIVMGLLITIIPQFSAAIDAPHNASNNISCGDCHGAALLNSPFWGGSGSYDQLCLNCHRVTSGPYTETNAPLVKTHSSLTTSNKYGDWTWECRNCHDPHYQRQKNYKTTDASRLYLATGTITSCVYNGNGTSTLTYSTITYKSGCDCTKLTDKTGDYRRTVLFPNANKLGYNYPIKAIDTGAKTITVSGDATAYLYPPTTFAAMYGQYVKDVMNVSGTDKTVKFFDQTGTNSYADGNTTCDGICETCHTKTTHYKNDGSGSDQHHMNIKVGGEDGQKCTTCHPHIDGFKPNCNACHGYPPGLNGGSLVFIDKDGNSVTSDSSGMGAHATHYTVGFVCINCHTGGMLQGAPQGDGLINIGFNLNSTNLGGTYDGKTGRTVFPYVAGGSTTVTANGSLECSNLYCHGSTLAPDGGTDTTPVWNDPSTGACGTCHGATAANPPTRGSHSIHAGSAGGGEQLACTACHSNYPTNHVNGSVNLQAGSGVNFSYTVGGACSNISCHNNTNAQWGTSACLNCHSMSLGNRAAITTQFSGNSHHVQGVMLTSAHCYQCHWEANSDGTINGIYHGGSGASAVDLVIYAAGTRPATYTLGTTAVQYTANGARTEIQKINSHCLSCHSDQNNSTTPFADGKTPKQYAWDGTSVAAKYSQTGTTTWGKYSGANITPKNTQTKAYSAHGNAINNQGGWDLSETWTNTRNGSENIACFDCHNSHGSSVSGTTTNYTSATTNGGILKNTLASKGGYSLTYKPAPGGSSDNKNAYNSGAGLCFDCHMTAASGTTPWGYNNTFGATQAIMGYRDTPYFGPGTSGSKLRYPYKTRPNMGGHFGASSALSGAPTGTINGLCTPCHDPHGVSPTLGTNQQYSMPLLKGTWLTSPYKEDVAPANNTTWTINDVNAGNVYHIDQNTFGSNIRDAVTGITQTDTQFASLCLTCHTKNSLTDGNNGGTWKSIDRIHESVKGWGANAKHKYPCSKCHATHNSRLPRLMVTNCLNYNHKGRVSFNANPALSGSGSDCWYYEGSDGGPLGNYQECGSGSGRFPGSYSGDDQGDHTVTCHENNAADQSWNVKTQWVSLTPPAPTLIDEPDAPCSSSCAVTLNWNAVTGPDGDPVQYYLQVDDASDFSSPNYTSGWISGRSATTSALATDKTYYWRVQARDSVHTTYVSSWSSYDTFTLMPPAPPPAPTLIDEPYASCSSSCAVTLDWNAVTAPDGHSVQYYLQVDDASDFSSPNYTSGWISGRSATTSALATNKTWYWRVQARDSVDTTYVSSWSSYDSFDLVQPPSTPTLTDEPDAVCGSSCAVTLDWNAVTAPDGHSVQYYLQVDDASDFSSPNYTSGWISGRSATTSALATNKTWYWRVQARDSNHTEAVSSWSLSDRFILSDGIAPPQVTLVSPANGTTVYSDFSFQWNAVPPVAEYQVQYSTDSTFNTGVVSSGWITSTAWNPYPGLGTYYWRVQARNSVSQATGPWSLSWSVTINDGCYGDSCCLYGCPSSCPFVYVWNGSSYSYLTDLAGEMMARGAGSKEKVAEDTELYGPNFFVLNGLVRDEDNNYKVKMRETIAEADYFDQAKLLLVDHPAGYEVFVSTPAETYVYGYSTPFQVYAVKDARPPVTATDKYGGNVTDSLIAVDGRTAPVDLAGEDYYTLDFGNIGHPEYAKLVIDGWTVIDQSVTYPATGGSPSYVEVIDENGNWVAVKTAGRPEGDLKTMVVDLSGLFKSSDQRIRFHAGTRRRSKMIIDRIRLSDSAPVPVNIREVVASSADLHHRGADRVRYVSLRGRTTAEDATLPDHTNSYLYGAFTAYGDVTPLLSDSDDMYAVIRHGDELTMIFPDAAAPPDGWERSVIFKADVFYKGMATGTSIDPLPFHGMSIYPYDPTVEHYPVDAEHQQYLIKFNTREY